MYQTRINLGDPVNRYNINEKKLNILIVDDDETSRNLFKEMLELRGHKITTLDEGLKCINRCSKNKYDIIFMDYHMEDVDGSEITGTEITNMLKDYFDVDSMIFAYTGDNSIDAIKDFKLNGFTGAIIKPMDPILLNEFMNIIENDNDEKQKIKKLAIKHKNFIYFK